MIHHYKKYIFLLLKLGLMLGAFYYIYVNTDLKEIAHYIRHISVFAFFWTALLVTLAQIISALRSQWYFSQAGLSLSRHFSIALYFTGSLYNSMLPGGISGDGYKIYLLGKLAHLKRKTIFRILLSERANGLYALILLTLISAYLGNFSELIPHGNFLLISCAVIVSIGYGLSAFYILRESFTTMRGAAYYSLILQLLYGAAAIVILQQLNINLFNIPILFGYITLFFVSNIISIIPISINGIGLRELTFFYGAPLLGLDQEQGIALGISYFIVCLLMSLNGLFFWHKLEKIYQRAPTQHKKPNRD